MTALIWNADLEILAMCKRLCEVLIKVVECYLEYKACGML